MTDLYVRSIEAQIIGRVFTYDGAIHFVLGADAHTGMARCSRRTADGPGITYLAMTEVRQLLAERAAAEQAEAAEREAPTPGPAAARGQDQVIYLPAHTPPTCAQLNAPNP